MSEIVKINIVILNSVDLLDTDFETVIEAFLSITGRQHWADLAGQFEAMGGIFYKSYLQIKNPFVEAIRQYHALLQARERVFKNRTPEIDHLVQKIFIFNRVWNHVSDRARKELIARVKDDDIRSLLHEITMATHFLRRNFDLDFVEYERNANGGRTFDFLISKGSMQAEVECKTKSYDAGRNIKRDGLYILFDEIIKQLSDYKVKCVVEINCSRPLGRKQSDFIQIARELKFALNRKETNINCYHDFSINIHYLSPELVIDSNEAFEAAIQPFWTPKSHFSTLSNNETTIIIKVESESQDDILNPIYEELKKSLGQFSSQKPALIACYLEGIYPEQWEGLTGAKGLAAMTTKILKKEKATHVHTLGYSSEVDIIKSGNVIDHTYPVLFFKNPNCLYYKGIDIFELKH